MAFKVLLIDDEPWALEGLEIWIPWEELGLEVCGTCANGVQGLKMLQEYEPDLVVVDIHMPIMDGLQMIEEWRKRGHHQTKFIILSGYSDFDYARKALKYKVSGYLLKPLDEEQAEGQIRAVVQEITSEQEQLHIGKVAQREKELFMIKDLLLGKPLSVLHHDHVRSLSLLASNWNVCVVQVPRHQAARLSEITADFLNGLDTVYLVHLRMDYFSIVFGDQIHQSENESAERRIEALARRLAGFRVFMSMGESVTSLTEIQTSYKTAVEALAHAFYESEENGIIHYTAIQERHFQNYYDQVELVERILEAFHIIDLAGYKSSVDFIEHSFREANLHPDEAQKFVVYLLYEIRTYMSIAFEDDAKTSSRLFEIPNMNEALLTFDDLISMLRSCGKVCFELLLKENTSEPQGIVQDINEYIRGHFREALSIKMLAERFFLHPAYLGQLLMRKNGIGFNELLHNLRIEESTRLLRMNQYKNSEISEMVGYTSYNHFLKQFEKRFKVSPNEYKKESTSELTDSKT